MGEANHNISNSAEALRKLRDSVELAAARSGIRVLEEMEFPERPARYGPIPQQLHPYLCNYLAREFGNKLYRHQSEAIAKSLEGSDICLATPTASGKSLVFMVAAAELLISDPTARVLALYPAKALIQDQQDKWKQLLSKFGFETGYIDGGVPVNTRSGILARHRVILMTPDVAHAWLMSHLDDNEVSSFLSGLGIVILDETHVYDGVFGSNMAYFLRRLQAVSKIERFISSTATIGNAELSLEKLIGRRPVVFDRNQDGAASPPKAVLLARPQKTNGFGSLVAVLNELCRVGVGRFLAFGDSRKMVERIVAATKRESTAGEDERTERKGDEVESKILPYRAGYEEHDRQAIQRALEKGDLSGVVSTSALELGLDIGEINVVVLMGGPPTVRAFWQRFGRAGRKQPGVCLLVDDKQLLHRPGALSTYLSRAPEPAWLYLDNRYIQYSNALCACAESFCGFQREQAFETLPGAFSEMLENELNPTRPIPEDLYALKQRAQSTPHYEFPLRSGTEKNFSIRLRQSLDVETLGTITYPQLLREAYPGAIYYYMAKPYRVIEIRYLQGEVLVARDKYYTTTPIAQNKVFPKFQGGALQFLRSTEGFVAELDLQVSERVLGFVEQHGGTKVQPQYTTGSNYWQRPLTRLFQTTGVCWWFRDSRLLGEAVALAIKEAFCLLCGVQGRDLGVGTFFSHFSPIGGDSCEGVTIYDAVNGSLRLSQQLVERFTEVVELALQAEQEAQEPDPNLLARLRDLGKSAASLQEDTFLPVETTEEVESDWVTVVAEGQPARCLLSTGETQEVEVRSFRYTPHGLMYELVPPEPGTTWMVKASTVLPIPGRTQLIEANLVTGETRSIESH